MAEEFTVKDGWFSWIPSWIYQFDISKEGLTLFSYKIRWLWVLLVIALILYVLYDKGYIGRKPTATETAIGFAKDTVLNQMGDIPVNIPIPSKYLH
jgi:hypothetical protein